MTANYETLNEYLDALDAIKEKVAAETQKKASGKAQMASLTEMRAKREKRLTGTNEVNR